MNKFWKIIFGIEEQKEECKHSQLLVNIASIKCQNCPFIRYYKEKTENGELYIDKDIKTTNVIENDTNSRI